MKNDENGPDAIKAISGSCKRRLCALAAVLLDREDEALSCDPNADDLTLLSACETTCFTIKDGTLTFDRIETRNQLIAEHHYLELSENDVATDKTWLQRADEIWGHEISFRDKASGRFLALRHKEHDILIAAAKTIETDAMDVFNVLNLVEAALPYLNPIPTDGLLALCDAQYEKTKNDGARGLLFNSIEKHLGHESLLCSELLDKLRTNIKETTASLYTSTSIAWSKTEPKTVIERTLHDAQSSNTLLVSQALCVLGNLIALQRISPITLDKVVQTIRKNIKSNSEAVSEAATYALVSAAPKVTVLADDLVQLAEQGNKSALLALSHLLFTELENIKTHQYFERWVSSLSQLPTDATGAIRFFDFILQSLLKDGRKAVVQRCIESWLIARSSDVPIDRSFPESLSSTTSEITQDKDFLSQIITEWLMSENSSLVSASAGILSYLSVHKIGEIRFSRPIIDELDNKNLILLIRRTLGVVITDEQLMSLILSLLNTKDAKDRTFNLVEEVLINEVGVDYPDLTIESLKSLKADQDDEMVHQLCDRVIAGLKTYLSAINELPRIDELRPSLRFVESFAKARAKAMEKAQEKAQEKSIIQQLMTTVPLKAGKASFSSQDGQYPEASLLHSYSFEVTLPRRHVLDAVGYEFHLFLYRLAKRDAE